MSHGVALPLQAIERPAWKTAVSWTAAVLIAAVFLVSGLWKATDPTGAAVLLAQAKVPQQLSVATAILLGIAETFAGVLFMVPAFRRWASWLGSALLLAFMVYIAVFYNELRGQECSCFPWLKRAVGPAFFVEDAVMLLLAIAAGVFARPSERMRSALLVLAAVCVFSGVSYGVAATRQTGTKAPETVMVDGKPFSLEQGRVFVYFFDPECMHCLEAGQKMAKLNWGDTRFVGVPTTQPQFAPDFMQRTGLHRPITTDLAKLKAVFPVKSTPGGIALEEGRQKAELTQFDGEEPATTLKKLGFIY